MRRDFQLTLAVVALLALQTVNGTPCGTSMKFVSLSHSALRSQINQVFLENLSTIQLLEAPDLRRGLLSLKSDHLPFDDMIVERDGRHGLVATMMTVGGGMRTPE